MFNTPPEVWQQKFWKNDACKKLPNFGDSVWFRVHFQALLAVKLPGGRVSTYRPHPTIGLGLQQVNRVETQGSHFLLI